MLEQVLPLLGWLMALGIGLGSGSYATMPYYRLAHGEACAGKWIGRKSHCTACDAQLRTRDLVPVFNWLWTRGRCYACNAPVSRAYFFVEFSVTVGSLLAYWRYGASQEYLVLHLLFCSFAVAAMSDVTYRVIPHAALVVAVMMGLVLRALEFGEVLSAIQGLVLGVLIGLAVAKFWEKRHAMAAFPRYDMLRLLAVCGLCLGLTQALLALPFLLGGWLILRLVARRWLAWWPVMVTVCFLLR